MLSLSEGNSFYLFGCGVDLRKGFNTLGGVIEQGGRKATDGCVYIFVNRARTTLKFLHWERGGYVIYHKRLEQGRISHKIFVGQSATFSPIRWDEIMLLLEGISPKAKRRKRYNLS